MRKGNHDEHRHIVLRIASAIALAGVLVISPPIKVPTASALTVFTDDFSSAGFTNWTGVTGLTIDPGTGRVAPPSAKAQAVAAPAFAYKLLPSTLDTVCMSMNVNATSLGAGSSVLLRLRTSRERPDHPGLRRPPGSCGSKSDVSAAQRSSGVALGTGWHGIELCGTVGTSGSWDLYRDGVKIVSGWVANTGTTPVGRVEIGDNGAKTFTMNFDDVVVTDTHASADVDPPTIPGKPTGSSPWPGPSRSAGRRLRTHRRRSPTGSTVTATRRRSGARRRRASPTPVSFPGRRTPTWSTRSTPQQPAELEEPIVGPDPVSALTTVFTDDFSSAGFTNWTGVTGLTIDPGTGRVAPPSAKAQAVAAPAFAYKLLPSDAQHGLHEHERERDVARHRLRSLLRLRTAANGPIARVFTASAGILWLKSDVSAAQTELRRRPGDRVARHRAVRHGRNIRFVGSLP